MILQRLACEKAVEIGTLPGPANADVVTDWNEIAEAVAPIFGGPQPQSRVQARDHGDLRPA
jgi:hypothetical protein